MKTFVTLLALVFLAATAAADHECTTESTATVGDYYLVVDDCTLDGSCLFSIWVYQEGNGHPGLQRCDEISECECSGEYESDTILF